MTDNSPVSRNASAVAMMLFPLLFIGVFVMHFRHPGDFFHFHLHYIPRDPAAVVTWFVHAQNRWPLFSDPHMIGYLGLPLLPLCAYALYTVGRTVRPLLSGIALFTTVAGTIYLGVSFGCGATCRAHGSSVFNVDQQLNTGVAADISRHDRAARSGW